MIFGLKVLLIVIACCLFWFSVWYLSEWYRHVKKTKKENEKWGKATFREFKYKFDNTDWKYGQEGISNYETETFIILL